jgi:hypothetical protein
LVIALPKLVCRISPSKFSHLSCIVLSVSESILFVVEAKPSELEQISSEANFQNPFSTSTVPEKLLVKTDTFEPVFPTAGPGSFEHASRASPWTPLGQPPLSNESYLLLCSTGTEEATNGHRMAGGHAFAAAVSAFSSGKSSYFLHHLSVSENGDSDESDDFDDFDDAKGGNSEDADSAADGESANHWQNVALTFSKNYAVKQHSSIYKRSSFVCCTLFVHNFWQTEYIL